MPMPTTLVIQNSGRSIVSTNYWDSDYAVHGLLYLSWNAGAARLLIPDNQSQMLSEMATAHEVIVSRGPWESEDGPRDALELLFEDRSDAPFYVQIVSEQTDRMIPQSQQGAGFDLDAWTRAGLAKSWPGKYRMVSSLPCLAAWQAH